MTTTLRIEPVSPYITPIEKLLQEYVSLANPSLPKRVYLVRGSVLAQTSQKCQATYIPDKLEDRQLLKVFRQHPNPAVDFGTFMRRVHKGYNVDKALTTPLRVTKRRSFSRRKSATRLAYELASKPPVVSYVTFYARVQQLKWPVDKALYTLPSAANKVPH